MKTEEAKQYSGRMYPTKSRLLELFQYHSDGYLVSKSNGKFNSLQKNSYSRILVDGQLFAVHKCIYIIHQPYETFEECVKAYHFGKWLSETQGKLYFQGQNFQSNRQHYVIDHFDHDKQNNRIENLRLITKKENFERSPKTNARWHKFLYMKYSNQRMVEVDSI